MTNEEAVNVLRIMASGIELKGYTDIWVQSFKEAYELAIKTLEGERPQGEWIMQRHDLDGCFYTCSNCGRMIRVPLFIDDPEDNETLADYPFCHCGAKMKGGAE